VERVLARVYGSECVVNEQLVSCVRDGCKRGAQVRARGLHFRVCTQNTETDDCGTDSSSNMGRQVCVRAANSVA
jgi:hypothetical protein